jgi:serine/threonine protein kinase/Tol biopolymer transport system component
MPEIGQTISHYRVVEKIGAGGMGEVYLADDLSLDRRVALKFLPELFAGDAERMARFEREAKLLASLNHPNIAAIYGLEQAEGKRFIAMEFAEGETLADRIKKGPIPVEESLKLALQIAEALEAAHERGVIHRDLKPANIKVTPEGKVKVLDFGLAKAFAGDPEDVNLSNSPTLSVAATQQGMILGTAAYMSPEQAKGKTVDKRSDIWAFGAVLFEMLTGKPAFPGEEISEILASVIKGDSNLNLLPPNIHPRVREAITRCLQKDLSKRYYDVADGRYEIEQVLADPGGVLLQTIAGTEPRPKTRTILPWVAAVAITAIVAGAIAWVLKPTPQPEPRRVMRFDYELPDDQQLGDVTERAIAISPDGSQFVYKTEKGLYLRSMTDLNARLISGTGEHPQKPFFSPDGQWIGYVSGVDNKLKKIPINGGEPVTLANDNSTGFFSWGADHTIVWATGTGQTIMRVSEKRGNPELLAKTEGVSIIAPQILPGGKNVMYSKVLASPRKVVVQSLESRTRKELLIGDTAQYLPSGHLVYAVDNDLFAVPFDPVRLEKKGDSVPVVEGVFRASGAPQYAVSDSGTLVYMPGGLVSMQLILVWVDRQGKEEPIEAPHNYYSNPRLSPDGTRIAVTVLSPEGKQEICIYDLKHGILTPLVSQIFTVSASRELTPLWSPDGKRIVFSVNREGIQGIYSKSADGAGTEDLIGSVPDMIISASAWLGDGKQLIIMGRDRNASLSFNNDIGILSLQGDRKWRPLLQEKYNELQPQISPNGRWIAYVSQESGSYEIFVRSFPEVHAGRWHISPKGGHSPLWSRDGRELFYRSGDQVMAVAVNTEHSFSFEKPKALFQDHYLSLASFPNSWDISLDGKRFLMIKGAGSNASDSGGPRRINIVLNWIEELKRLVPTSK